MGEVELLKKLDELKGELEFLKNEIEVIKKSVGAITDGGTKVDEKIFLEKVYTVEEPKRYIGVNSTKEIGELNV